jgi:hypothetical protein
MSRPTCLCRSLQSFQTKVLHARLLLVVAHVERAVTPCALCLELKLCRLWHSHLVICQSSCSCISYTRCVAAAVLIAHVEVVQVIVGTSVVCGKVESGVLICQIGVAHVGSSPAHALIACIALALMRVEVLAQLGVSVVGDVCHGLCDSSKGGDGKASSSSSRQGGVSRSKQRNVAAGVEGGYTNATDSGSAAVDVEPRGYVGSRRLSEESAQSRVRTDEAQADGERRAGSRIECADSEGAEQVRVHTVDTIVYGRLSSNRTLWNRTVRPKERQTLARAQAGEYAKQCDTASSKATTRRTDCLSLWDQAVTLEMDRRIVRMCRCRAVYKAVVLRFNVVNARAERVRDAEQQHAQRAAAEAPMFSGALS